MRLSYALTLLAPLALVSISCSSSSDSGPSTPADSGTSGDTGIKTDSGSKTDTDSPTDTAAETPTPALEITVGGTGLVFKPATATIKVGDTVKWTWAASGHSVTSGDSAACTPGTSADDFDSTVQSSGSTFTHTFTKAGTVNYFCVPHCAAGMKGSIVVTP